MKADFFDDEQMKLKLDIQFFGGRGAWSGIGTSSSNSGRAMKYKDVTKQFQGMNLHQFENTIRDRKTEYAGIFDKNGILKIAVTSGNSHAVGILVVEAMGEATLTHNHPYQPRDERNRMIGATFSEADVMNHINLKLGQMRAVSHGPNLSAPEKTPILQECIKLLLIHGQIIR